MKAVVFDLDGTLIDSAPDLHAAANAVLAEVGLGPLDLATVTGFIGNGVPTLVARCFAYHGAEPDDPAAAVRLFRARYTAENHARTVLYPGVARAVAALKEASHSPSAPTRTPPWRATFSSGMASTGT